MLNFAQQSVNLPAATPEPLLGLFYKIKFLASVLPDRDDVLPNVTSDHDRTDG
jgi:hypothetical protein